MNGRICPNGHFRADGDRPCSECPSRDTEIERIAAVLREHTAKDGRITPPLTWDDCRVPHKGRYMTPDEFAAALYDAGLRSQPASEPSLDGQRLAPDPKQSSEYHRGWRAAMMAAAPSLDVDRLFAAWPDDVSPRRGKYVISIGAFLEELAAEYHRLSQPADNEAAATPESRTDQE